MNSFDILEPLSRRRSRIKALADQINALGRSRDGLASAIDKYKAFRPDVEKNNLESLESTTKKLSERISDQEIRRLNSARQLEDVNAAQVSRLKIWKYFTSEQSRLRFESSKLSSEIFVIDLSISKDQEALSKARADINTARRSITEYKNFDLGDCEKRLADLILEIERLKGVQAEDEAEVVKIDGLIRPHIIELDRLKSEVMTLNSDMMSASKFEKELSSAMNGYERAMIHEKCEEIFGTGRPKQVINDRKKKIRSLENNIPKLERRIRDELKKLERTISHLLIDGNNACYEGQSFIGLQAISALLPTLINRFKTTVVFDASIRAMLKTDNQGIERILGAAVNTHVAPSKQAADEYILKLAEEDKNTFILSNDRFSEYHDYDAVKSGRVLRFLIAENKFMANDLDVVANF